MYGSDLSVPSVANTAAAPHTALPAEINTALSLSKPNILVPNNYKLKYLPENKAFALPNNGGKLVLNSKNIGNKIIVLFQFEFKKVLYTNEEYFALKEFFNQIIKAQSTLITLEKIN